MKKIPKIINEQIKNNYEFSSNKEDKIKAAQFGYQLATDGREELEKKISELKLALCGYDNMIIDFTKEVERLQSQCTEKDQEIERLKGALNYLVMLKDHKDQDGKDAFYNENQPKAWDNARQLLNK